MMLLYKFSLRFSYSCDVVKDTMINELVCVGRKSLNGRMLSGKGHFLISGTNTGHFDKCPSVSELQEADYSAA